jgi:hypothetical protein
VSGPGDPARDEDDRFAPRDPALDPDDRFDGTDEMLKAEGWAAGLDVWEQVEKAYMAYLRGDGQLANAQLWSLRQAIRRQVAEDAPRGQ